MKRGENIHGLLNELLANELTAINQYLIHASVCERAGFQRLAAKFREESLDERSHADLIIKRILFLEGTPDMQRYHEVQARQTVREMLQADLELEYDAIKVLNRAIDIVRAAGDNGTEALMIGILAAEEHGTLWLETQLRLIETLGEQNYLAQQLQP